MSIPRTVILLSFLAGIFAAFAPFAWLPRDAKVPHCLLSQLFLVDDLRGSIALGAHLTAISVAWLGIVFPSKLWLRTSSFDKALAVGTILPAIRALFIDEPYFLVVTFFLVVFLIWGAFEWCLTDGLQKLVEKWRARR